VSACDGCDGLGSIPLHIGACPGMSGDDCECLTTVDVSCPECDGGAAAEVARQQDL
jgi:hypothetical protein